jgi:hypothetical protein
VLGSADDTSLALHPCFILRGGSSSALFGHCRTGDKIERTDEGTDVFTEKATSAVVRHGVVAVVSVGRCKCVCGRAGGNARCVKRSVRRADGGDGVKEGLRGDQIGYRCSACV